MANTISTSGNATLTIGGLRVVGDFTMTSMNMTGSNVTANVQNIATTSWQGLDTSSLADVRFVYLSNDGSGSIQVATDSAGTKVATILQPNDWAFLPWSGSTQLYAKAFNSASVLQTIIAES